MTIDIEELKKLAENCPSKDWKRSAKHQHDILSQEDWPGQIAKVWMPQHRAFIAAANPQTVLALIGAIETLRAQFEDLHKRHLDLAVKIVHGGK